MNEMGGLHEERFGGSGRGMENESEGWGVESGGGDGSEMGSVMEASLGRLGERVGRVTTTGGCWLLEATVTGQLVETNH